MITKFKKPVAASGATIENEPIIQSDGASSDVMEWQASTGSSKVEIREDASNNLKLEVDGIPVASGLAGIDAAGLHFDGSGDGITWTGQAIGTSDFSFEFISEFSSTASAPLFRLNGTSFDGQIRLDGELKIYWPSTGASSTTTISNTIETGKVQHVVISANRDGNCDVYINGSLDKATDISAKSSENFSSTDQRLYNRADETFYRIRIWNRALSSTDVTRIYENATVPFADQYGSQTSLVDAAASVFTSGTYNWTEYGSNTIANVGNALEITYVNHASGAQDILRNASDLTTDLTVGKRYRLTVDAKYAGGSAGSKLQLSLAGSNTDFATLTTSLVTYTHEFTTDTAAGGTFRLSGMSAGNVVTIDNWYLREIGCVADYELSANPTQSTMVQDRSTNGVDGTASSGVTQVTPLVQVNATAARIGTSAATPADGEVIAAGNVLVGKTTASSSVHGGEIRATGQVVAAVDGSWASLFNRETDNGEIIRLKKDDITVGSVGSISSDLYIAEGDAGIRFDGENNQILPCSTTASTNGTLTLGAASAKFNDAHFSGTVNAGGIAFQSATTGSGTGTGYTLDSYETGIFTPVVADAGTGGNAASAGTANGRYTKVGNRVYCQVSIINITTTGLTAGNLVYVRGLPFTSISTVNFYSPVEVFQGAMTSTEGVIHGLIHPNTDYMSMYNSISGSAGSTSAIVSQITSGSGDMYMSFQYETAL